MRESMYRCIVLLGACFSAFSCDWLFGPKLEGKAEPTLVIEGAASPSAGFFHALAIDGSGGLWSWGHDAHGQLGRGEPGTDKADPGRVGSELDWDAVSAGSLHSLAIKEDGSLWTWGCNEFGQLGIGSSGLETSVSAPVRVGTDSDWITVSAGGDFSAGIREGGSLWLWGNNASAQLGTGDALTRTSPVRISDAISWASVSCGHHHVLALSVSGGLYSWGDNEFGQLGNGASGLGQGSYLPGQIMQGTAFAFIAAGGYHSAAIDADGTLFLWGRNDWGQLGNGESGEGKLLATPTALGEGTWSSVSLGAFHSTGLGSDHSLWTWGSNEFGQLGDGDYGDTALSAQPKRVGAERSWASVSLGVFFSLGLDASGSLFAWGRDEFGQLGQGED